MTRWRSSPASTDASGDGPVTAGPGSNRSTTFWWRRRDRAPLIETEDFRDEGARRFWDDFSPPYFGFKKGPMDTYGWNSETFALAAAGRYWAYWKNRISNADPAHSK